MSGITTKSPVPTSVTLPPDPLKKQVGGNHYKGFAIQPVEYIHQNQLGFLAGCIIKRVCRFNQPGGKGAEDIQKVIHEIDLLIDQLHKGFEMKSVFTRYSDLPITPPVFCAANGFNDCQLHIIQSVTHYNQHHGYGVIQLRHAQEKAESLLLTI
jgi:hypothetical protein